MGFFGGGGGSSVDLTSPGPIGSTTPDTGAFTTLSATPPANTTAFNSTGYSLTGTNAQTLLNLTGTWNTSGTPTAIKLNVTDTASNTNSLLMDLQVGGSSILSLRKNGALTLASTGSFIVNSGGSQLRGIQIGADGITSYTATTPSYWFFVNSGIIEQRNSTNAQSYRLYNTYTDASNYERGFFRWSSNVLEIGTEAAGTGTQRQLRLPLGTVTASTPLSVTQTWNSAGVTFTGIQANITDTASASASLLMDLQVGGTSKFKIDKNGNTTLASGNLLIRNNGTSGRSQLYSVGDAADVLEFRAANYIGIRSDMAFAWAVGAIGINTVYDLFLYKDAANILAQRNSTNAQTYRLYRTYTDASNYERIGFLTTNTTRYTITSENAGTGSARSLELSFYTSASDPTSSDITSGCFSVWKNSGTGTIKLWANDGGTMKSVALA